jgi:hypothetical protein
MVSLKLGQAAIESVSLWLRLAETERWLATSTRPFGVMFRPIDPPVPARKQRGNRMSLCDRPAATTRRCALKDADRAARHPQVFDYCFKLTATDDSFQNLTVMDDQPADAGSRVCENSGTLAALRRRSSVSGFGAAEYRIPFAARPRDVAQSRLPAAGLSSRRKVRCCRKHPRDPGCDQLRRAARWGLCCGFVLATALLKSVFMHRP